MRRNQAALSAAVGGAAAALICAAILGTHHEPQGIASVGTATAPSPSSTVSAAAAFDALQDLHGLPVSDAYVPGYDRAAFGPRGPTWTTTAATPATTSSAGISSTS